MKMTKRILSLALALVMVLSYIPAAAFAADSTPALPTASVKEISNDELTFAMNFKVNLITEEQLAYYGNWYADFELTINKDVTFNADGSADGWLSGQYDEWSENWVNVPFGKFAPTTIKANEPLRIMAFAAEMMDEKGLKYTYKEVYETVRNFDCGVFFDDEFLLANPDLEVKLELKMYNPANEAESYVIGETYTYENPIVAKNTTTNKAYATATEALLDCADGQTVVMLKDSVESVVYVFENMTLDLNGHTLVANYMSSFGNIIDSSASNAGLLKVSPKRIVLQEKNKQLPVRDGDGYRFVKVLRIDTAYVAAEKMFAFQPRFEPGMLELMKQSQDLTGVTIEVQVSWKENNGRRTQNFVYTDEFVQIYLNSYNPSADRYGQMFTLILDSTDGFEDLTFAAVAVSNTGVGVSSDDPIEEEPEYTVPTGMTATYGQTLADVTLPEGFAWKNPAASVGNAGNNTFVAVYTAANIEVEVTVAVAKADPVCIIPNGLTANYGQTLGEIVLPDGFAWKDASASVGNAGVNTFTAIFTPADEANFNAVEVSIPVTVLKINPEYTVPTNLTAIYGQKLSEIILPAGFTWKDANASVGNAGTNSFTVVFTPNDTNNYHIVEETVTVVVAKADPTPVIPTNLTAIYGQKLSEIILPAGFTWKNANASVGNAGVNTFVAIYTPEDTQNYNIIEVDVSLTVEKANPDYTIPTGLTATYGQTLAEIILPNGFTWVDANAPVGNAGTNSFTVVFTPADTDNYNIVEETVTVEVAKADPTPVIPSGLTANYNQTLADVTLGGGFEWDDPNTILKTVGVNTFKATYTPADTDNYNTITVEIQVEVIRVPVKKFASKIERDYDFLYRVGNMDTFPVGVLFSELDGAQIATNNVTVTVEGLNYTFAPNASDWKKSTLKLEGAGLVTVTITDNDYCIAETVTIEVIAAKNAYSGTFPSATGSNVVLLENAGAGGFTISGDYWFYGNGYTVTISGNGSYRSDNLNVGFVTMTGNAHLDNVKLICNLFPESYMFTNEMSAGSDGRYPYANAAVIASDNSSITNCYIYGARVNIQIKGGSVTIRDTVTESGSLANIHIFGADSDIVTLDNVTTIQTVKTADFDSSKRVYGFGILVGTTSSVEIPTVYLTGDLRQYNWATQSVADQVTSIYGKSAVNGALNATNYQHTVNGETAVNLGIVYIKKDLASAAKIIDKRDNKTEIPYELGEVTMKIQNVNVTGKVYSIINSEAAAERYDAAKDNVVGGMISTNATYIPQVVVDSNLGGQKIDKTDDADTFCYSDGKDIFVQFPQGESFELNLNTLPNISKYTGQTLNKTITCVDASGNEIPLANGVLSLTQPGEYTVTYAITDELVYDQNGELAGSTTYARRNASTVFTWSVKLVVTTKDTSLPNAYFEFDASKQKMGYYKPTIGDVKQYLPFLAGLKIYDYTGKTPYLRFDGSSDFKKVASVTITGYASNKASVEIKLTDGGVIYTQFLARANSGGGSTYTGKIKTSNNTIYFVTDSGTSNKDTTTTAAYWYVDYYKFVGNNGVAIQSAQQTFNSTGSSASTPSGNFSTSIKFTVTYDANGGNCLQSLSYATSASTAVTLPTPTRSGYIFAGWYTAASGGTRVGGAGESYTPSANITLYAQWGKPCTVTYNANGGSCGTTSEKYTGTSLVLPTPTRDGYWFIGWYDAANGGNKIGNAGAAYNPAGEITLYAQWQEAIEYTVTYNANGGTCGTASATYQGAALTLPTPTRTGYEFLGWYTAASGGTKIGDAGASYTPATNITLYAQWQINSYTIKVTTNNATVKVNGTTVSNNGTITIQYGAQVTVEVTYSQTESQSTTIKGTDGTNYTSPFNMPAQNVTISATSTAPSSGGGCVTPDTLITLADGTQVRVDELTGNEMLLVWNMEIGKLDAAPIMFIDCDPAVECNIIHLYFSDGSVVKVIYEHGFWDYDLNKYVYLDENAADYIGHWFAKQNGNDLTKVQLVDAVIEKTVSMAYSPVTAGHLCYFVNGMLSMPGGVGGLFNIFEVDPETMTYDYEAMAKDIETYGLFTYEEMNAIVPLPEDMFIAAGGAYLKVSIGKGNMTLDDLIYMIERYTKFFPA